MASELVKEEKVAAGFATAEKGEPANALITRAERRRTTHRLIRYLAKTGFGGESRSFGIFAPDRFLISTSTWLQLREQDRIPQQLSECVEIVSSLLNEVANHLGDDDYGILGFFDNAYKRLRKEDFNTNAPLTFAQDRWTDVWARLKNQSTYFFLRLGKSFTPRVPPMAEWRPKKLWLVYSTLHGCNESMAAAILPFYRRQMEMGYAWIDEFSDKDSPLSIQIQNELIDFLVTMKKCMGLLFFLWELRIPSAENSMIKHCPAAQEIWGTSYPSTRAERDGKEPGTG
ncbi:hypothetical protein BJ508DRAFT_416686 [Ascobolus immersus RN42]|uniref:Uncharacterized protein n=1 Tax=Ascobolus immersus RN42 TaxID=1160509 RepID=A0A3N4HW70_ASCIM|nr:hypothetical protein BJ508DRAFT_416686 [Ascobolus immersus RN42]